MPTTMDTYSPYGRESIQYDHVAYFTYDPQAIEQDEFLFLDKTTAVLGGLCQAASNGPPPTITLAATASTQSNFYTGNVLEAGGQWNVIGLYNGGTQVANVVQPWSVIPNANSGYIISVGRLRVFRVEGVKQTDFTKRLWRVMLNEELAKQ
jgi:hypothetical protein